MSDWLDERDFYEVMQQYRHAIDGLVGKDRPRPCAAEAFEAVKDFIRIRALASSPSQGWSDEAKEAQRRVLEEAAANVPSTWLDPLLTGPAAVIHDLPCDGPAIERLLDAVRKRILSTAAAIAAAPSLGEGKR